MVVTSQLSILLLALIRLSTAAQPTDYVYQFFAQTYQKIPGSGYLYNHADFLGYVEARNYLLLVNANSDDPKTKCPKTVQKADNCPPGNVTQLNSTIAGFSGETGRFFMNSVVDGQKLFAMPDGMVGYTSPKVAPPKGSYTDLWTLGFNCQGSQFELCEATLVFNNTQFPGGNLYSCPPPKSLRHIEAGVNVTYAPTPGFNRKGCTKVGLSSNTLVLNNNGESDDEPYPCPYQGYGESGDTYCPPIAYEYL